MKFKKPIEVQAGISDGDPDNPLGQAGYLLSSDGSNVNWVSPGGLSAETAEAIVQPIKANEALAKGDPVYIVGYNNGQDVNIVAKADSSDVAKMPVVGLADDDYASQAFGTITAFGSFNGAFDTTGGTENWAIGDIIFVKPGGGLTNIKPGGTDLIQNIAIVSRVQQNTGELEVIALGRTNDVPNLPEGRLFVGTSNNTSLASDVIYVDDTSDRVGIGTDDPEAKLEVVGESGVIIDSGSSSAAKLTLIGDDNDYGGGGIIDIIGGSSDFMSYNLNLKRSPSTLEAYNQYFMGSSRWTWDGNIGVTRAQPYTSYDFKTQGSSQMVIYNNNVGIGVTAPSQKLHVNGNARVTGAYYDSGNSPGAANTVLVSTISGTVWGVRGPLGGGTADYLVRWTPDGNTLGIGVTYDNGTSVGIGTTSPGTYKLAVAGSTAIGEDLEVSDGLGGDKTLVIDATGGAFQIGDIDGIADEAHIEGDGENIKIFNGGSLTLITDSGQNVGIGTDNPPSKLSVSGGTLSVSGSGAGFGVVKLGDPTDSNPYVGIYRSAAAAIATSGNFLNLGGYGGIAFTTGAAQLSGQSERMRILSNGNVGIGTSSPSDKLTVRNGTSNTDVKILAYNSAAGTEATLKFSTIASEANYEKAAIIARNAAGSFGRSDMHFALDSTADSGNVQFSDTKMTILNGGNVGIGTTTPDVKLEVESTTSASGIRIKNTNSGFASLDIESNRGTGSNLGGLRYRKTGQANSQAEINYVAGTRLDFLLGNGTAALTNKLSILENGNVGINDNTPSYKLDVAGTGRFTDILTSNKLLQIPVAGTTVNEGKGVGLTLTDDFPYVGNDSTTRYLNHYGMGIHKPLQATISGGNGAYLSGYFGVDIFTAGNSRIHVNQNGYVGIGTTDPNHELVVEGASSPNIELKNTSYSNGGFVLNRANYTQQWKWWAESSQMYFGFSTDESTYSNKLLIKSNGNVGIGATNPSEKLDVVGNIKVSGDQYFNGAAIYGDNKEIIRYSDTWLRINPANNFTNGIYCGSGILRTDGIFQVGPSGSKFVVNSIGNVGINGTPSTTTSTKLKVYGTITSTGGSGFQIENGYGNPRLGDFYGSFTTTHPLYVGSPYSGLACHASAFNITSDYRLKENEALLTEASSRIKKLKPIRFNYINSENTVDGFLAHEVAEVIPEAVTGEKDAIREDGSDELQGLDLSKIVPLLTAALQESITKIEKLEQRIQTLENK